MRKIIVIFILINTCVLNAQNFDLEDFNKKTDLTEWLYEYDLIAWKTSDSVMTEPKSELNKLGAEWFCFKDNNNLWHAFYGKGENGTFNTVFQYTVDATYNVKKTHLKTDSLQLNAYSNAIVNASKQLDELKDSVNIRFNQYVKLNNKNEIEVWILPAFQSNGTAVYGGEFHYVFNSTGEILISKDEYYQGNFKGFKVGEPREVWLGYTDTDKPTLGATFFVWYYKQYFTNIYIETSKHISTVFEVDGAYVWIHSEKDLGKKKKRKKKKKDKK